MDIQCPVVYSLTNLPTADINTEAWSASLCLRVRLTPSTCITPVTQTQDIQDRRNENRRSSKNKCLTTDKTGQGTELRGMEKCRWGSQGWIQAARPIWRRINTVTYNILIKYMVIRFVVPLWASIDAEPLPSSEVISTMVISITWRNSVRYARKIQKWFKCLSIRTIQLVVSVLMYAFNAHYTQQLHSH
jgi:hypothetical protein